VVYVGIYGVQQGLGDQVGGTVTSVVSVGAFFAPLMLAWMQRHSVRHAVRTGFLMSGGLFALAALFSPWPWVAVALLLVGACYLVLLDICGGLPFMMAVKPSQRTEMSAVYSTFRDVSGIVGPGVAWVVLQFSPVAGVFAAAGLALLGAWAVAGRLHPQLGVPGAQRVR
jgi:dolichol kinase